MRRKASRVTIELPPAHQSPGTLGALAAYVHYSDPSPAVVALRDLKAAHADDPLSPSQALSEAYGLLTTHEAMDDFLRWREGDGRGCAADWPTDLVRPPAI